MLLDHLAAFPLGYIPSAVESLTAIGRHNLSHHSLQERTAPQPTRSVGTQFEVFVSGTPVYAKKVHQQSNSALIPCPVELEEAVGSVGGMQREKKRQRESSQQSLPKSYKPPRQLSEHILQDVARTKPNSTNACTCIT